MSAKPPTCVHCKRPEMDHNATTRGCPIGRKHRVTGFTSYSAKTVFEPKLTGEMIATRIKEHLARFENDPVINKVNDYKVRPYYMANAWTVGPYIGVRYIAYQFTYNLAHQDALKYLRWLDAGNVGKHIKALEE